MRRIKSPETPQDEISEETIVSAPDVDLLVDLATDFNTTVRRLPNGEGYIQQHIALTACRKQANPGV